MECPCKVDHWLHLATGFAGIVSMMHFLSRAGVLASDDAMARMKTELAKLEQEVVTQEQLRGAAHGSV